MRRAGRALLGPLLRHEGGMSVVEFALGAPLLLAALSPVLDLGLAFQQQNEVQLAAQAGAQYALLHGWNSSAISNAVTSATALAALSATPAPAESCGCPSGTAVSAATCGSTCPNGESAGTYITVSAEAAYTPVVPYSLFGSGTTLSAAAVVRIQ